MGWGLGWGALAATRRRNDAEGAEEGAEAGTEKKAPGIREKESGIREEAAFGNRHSAFVKAGRNASVRRA